jgi:Haemolymph juvenile hormone binding protein (JHBP)
VYSAWFESMTHLTLFTADYLHVCKKTDPNLSSCVYNSVNTLKPYLVTGIPDLDIPSLEPIDLGDLIVAGSKTGQGLFITARDIQAYGASNWHLKNFK